MSTVDRIQENYAALSKTHKRIADYVAKNPETACFLSVRDLAKESNTTEATIFKFVKKIGYQSYNDFKKGLQTQIRNWLTPNEKIRQAVSSIPEHADVYEQVMRSEIDALRLTYEKTNVEALRHAVNVLTNAPKIYVVGHEVSEYIAMFGAFRLSQLGKQVEFLDLTRQQALTNCLVNMEENCAFLLISFPIYSPETMALADYLHQRQIRYIAITDRHSCGIAMHATVSLTCSNEDTIFVNTITPAVSLLNMLCSLLAVEMRSQFEHYRADAEGILQSFQAYIRENTADNQSEP